MAGRILRRQGWLGVGEAESIAGRIRNGLKGDLSLPDHVLLFLGVVYPLVKPLTRDTENASGI